jgi:hypothetical protein
MSCFRVVCARNVPKGTGSARSEDAEEAPFLRGAVAGGARQADQEMDLLSLCAERRRRSGPWVTRDREEHEPPDDDADRTPVLVVEDAEPAENRPMRQ